MSDLMLKNNGLKVISLKMTAVVFLLLTLLLLNLQSVASKSDTDTLRAFVRKELKEIKDATGIVKQQRFEKFLEVVPVIRDSEDTGLLLKSYNFLVECYLEWRQYDSALFYLNKINSYHPKKFDLLTQYEFETNKGVYFYYIRIFDSAYKAFSQCLNIAQEMDSAALLGYSYNNLGLLYDWQLDYQKAFEYYSMAMRMLEGKDLNNQIPVLVNNLGLMMYNLGEDERALKYYDQAIELNTQIMHAGNLAMNYGNKGNVLTALNRFEEALEAQKMAYHYAEIGNSPYEMSRALNNLGWIYFEMDSLLLAERTLTSSLQLNIETNLRYGMMMNYTLLWQIFHKQNKPMKAIPILDSILLMAKEFNTPIELVNAYQAKSEILEELGNPEEALEYLKLCTELNDSLVTIASKQYILDLQTKYETEAKDLENENLQRQNKIKERTIRLQWILNYGVMGILLISLILVWFIIRSRKKIRGYNASLRSLNKEINEQNANLEELNSTKDLLFSIISHDLRSPFNSLLGFLNIVIEDYETLSEGEKKEILSGLYDQSNKTYSLLDNLLRWAMNQRGQIDFHPIPIDLHELMESELLFLKARLEHKQLTWESIIPKATIIEADRNMLATIFRDLLNNAINYTDSGGEISIWTEESEYGITTFIRDTGKGMTIEKIDNILHCKSNIIVENIDKVRGAGLGLSIVKEFVRQHQGSLNIESELDKGSVFSVFLPFKSNPDNA